MLNTLTAVKLFLAGFIAFFATGLDDTLAYAPLLRSRIAKISVCSGIVSATVIDIFIAIYLSKYMAMLPFPHLIGATGLIALGILLYFKKIGRHKKHAKKHSDKHKSHIHKVHKHLRKKAINPEHPHPDRRMITELFSAGFLAFFFTGLDDTIAYAPLFINPLTRYIIIAGILVATFLDILIACFLSETFAKLPQPHKLGAILLIGLGMAVGLGIV